MYWYGRWVTSYKSGDKVIFIDKCDKTLKIFYQKNILHQTG